MIATDGSETSEKAARIGVGVAKLAGGRVTAVYVADTVRLAHLSGYLIFSGAIREMMLKEGEEATEFVEERAKEAGVECKRLVVEGNPSDELLRLSQEADLLVMGSVGRGGLDRFLLGSVAEKVVKHSRVPVLMVPGERGQAREVR